MITCLFIFLMLAIFGKLVIFAIKATWGITKVCLTLVFLPVVLIALAIGGLMYIALPALIIVGVVALVKGKIFV